MRKKIKENSKIMIAFFSGIFVFVGILTAVASWPTPPAGETFGGWLGSVFDLSNSGSGKLIVNSENLTLPNNIAITENEQVTTKKYVDNRVKAETIASSSGGSDVFCVGSDTYSNCSSINIPGYTKFQASDGRTCCWKKVDQGSGKRIFVTGVGYNGNLGGETGADAKCQARADVARLDGTFKAWLLDGTHEQYIYDKFADTSYYNMQGAKVITTFVDYNQGYTAFKVLEASIAYDEFGRGNTNFAWTGLDAGGNFYSAYSCDGFISTSTSTSGYIGYSGYTNYRWFAYSTRGCTTVNSLICVET